MLETYSKNITVSSNTDIPFTNDSLIKGCATTHDNATIGLNKCGIYKVDVNCTATIPSNSTATIQLVKNDVLQSQAVSTANNPDTSSSKVSDLSFTTLVQVPMDNTRCNCSEGTRISIRNVGNDITFNQVSCVVTKII